jgi:type 1 fimbria pilin
MRFAFWQNPFLLIVMIVSGLLSVLNCSIFKGRETSEHKNEFSRLLFLDSTTIVYVKTSYDERWFDGSLEDNQNSSFENISYTLESINPYSGAKDILLTVPNTSSTEIRGSGDLSYCPPILLISCMTYHDSNYYIWYYNTASKTSGSYVANDPQWMADSSGIAYDTHGNVFNPLTGDRLSALADSNVRVLYYSAKNQTVIYWKYTPYNPMTPFCQPWFGTYDPATGAMQVQKMSQSRCYTPFAAYYCRSLIFISSDNESTSRIEIIPVDSLDADLTKSQSFTLEFSAMNVNDVLVNRKLLLLQIGSTCWVRKFSGEIVAGPLDLQ